MSGSFYSWQSISIAVLVLYVLVALILQIKFYKKLKFRQQKYNKNLSDKLLKNYHQIEALFSLHQIIKPRLPLPQTREWAVSPDFINILVTQIKITKPKIILELGSGVSTIIAGYILETYHIDGKIISLEHKKQYLDVTYKNIINHKLQNVATVIHAPLEAATFNDNRHLWYSLDAIKDITHIDMLIVDGPPANTQKFARFPTLPALYNRLSKNAIIVLDDTNRTDEQKIMRLWEREHPHLHIEHFETEKGTTIIQITS